MAEIYVAFSVKSGFKAATTKVGLGKLLGVSADTVRRSLGDMAYGVGVGKDDWFIGVSELVKVGGDRGKTGYGGFRGMKGKDGLLVNPMGEK